MQRHAHERRNNTRHNQPDTAHLWGRLEFKSREN